MKGSNTRTVTCQAVERNQRETREGIARSASRELLLAQDAVLYEGYKGERAGRFATGYHQVRNGVCKEYMCESWGSRWRLSFWYRHWIALKWGYISLQIDTSYIDWPPSAYENRPQKCGATHYCVHRYRASVVITCMCAEALRVTLMYLNNF